MQLFRKYLIRYLLVWLSLTCLAAYFWPEIQSVGGVYLQKIHPFKISDRSMQLMIATTMLIIGSLLPLEEIRLVARRWYLVLGGTAIQYISMPLLAYGCAKIFSLDGPWMFGIMIVGCVPGAMASNMLTMIARGNVSYSIGLTTSSTLLSPLCVPLLLTFFLSKSIPLDASKMSLNLLLTVVCPVVIGFFLARIFSFWRWIANLFGEILANLVIIWIIASVTAANHGKFHEIPLILILALLCINIGGYLSGWFGGWFIGADEKMRRALTLEIGMQNAGLGTMLAQIYYPEDPRAALCCAMYTFGCMFTGIILAQCFHTMSDNAD